MDENVAADEARRFGIAPLPAYFLRQIMPSRALEIEPQRDIEAQIERELVMNGHCLVRSPS